MTRIKSVRFKKYNSLPVINLSAEWVAVCEGGVWSAALFYPDEYSMRWERVA